MKTTSISYQQTIPTGSYANERLGVEIELSEGEHPEDAFAYAKELVEKIHRDNNPQLYGTKNIFDGSSANRFRVDEVGQMPQLQNKNEHQLPLTPAQKKQLQIQSTIKQINEITDPTVLESFRLIAKNNPELQEAYNNKEKELVQTTLGNRI